MEIRFTVPAVPVAQPRQRHRLVTTATKQFVQNYTPERDPVNRFKATVAIMFRATYKGEPLKGPLRCDLVFVMPRPKSMIWKTKPMPRVYYTGKPDVDNLMKAVFDGLKSIAWIDDAQVCSGFNLKVIAAGDESSHVSVMIRELE
jgi:Holliday junction resolvase RusA-like endonuclease